MGTELLGLNCIFHVRLMFLAFGNNCNQLCRTDCLLLLTFCAPRCSRYELCY